jgi:RND family efflux transporter MFP subunit
MKSLSSSLGWAGLFCAIGLTACDRSRPAASSAPPAVARVVQVARAESRPLERTLTVVGTLAAREEATIAAQVAGQLEQSYVEIGSAVAAGQALALIDTAAYEALAKVSAANLARAKASAANAAQNLKRVQDLQREKIASSSDLDAAVAEAASTQADVRAAEAQEAVARLNLERSHVRAPFAGVVAERIASPGDYLAVGAPIVRLVQTNPLRLRLEVPERESAAVRPGQAVRVTVEGDTNVYAGELARLAPAIREASRMLLVEADVANPGGLRAGLFARARIVVNPREPAVCAPTAALINFAGLEKVVVLKDGKAIEKTVTSGRRDGSWIEIVSGLTAGETLVLNPAGIRTGQALVTEPAPGAAAPATNRPAR